MPEVKLSDLKEKGKDGKEDMMKAFQVYIKYGMPILITFMSFGFSAALTLY